MVNTYEDIALRMPIKRLLKHKTVSFHSNTKWKYIFKVSKSDKDKVGLYCPTASGSFPV